MTSPALCDIGANLTDKSFSNDLDKVLSDAKAVSVATMVVTGTSAENSEAAYQLSCAHPKTLWSTAGVHPHYAKQCNEKTIPTLRNLATKDQVVAIGECGLDYNRNLSDPDQQRYWFEEQVKLACELQMPLFLHERDALEDQLCVLKKYRSQFPRAVVHCFTGTAEALRAYLALDLHIGITGWICDERRGTHLLELIKEIPLDRLMIETDAPYLMPRTIRPRPKTRRNVPANLPYVLQRVASCLHKSPQEIATTTTATAIDFFEFQTKALATKHPKTQEEQR